MSVDADKRREWLRALRRFKRGMKLRAKLGVLDVICQQVGDQRRGKMQWDAPQWTDDRWVTLLYNCIKDNQYPTIILEGFAKTAEITFFAPSKRPTVPKTLAAVDTVCRQLSRPLRVKFGVIGERDESSEGHPSGG